MTITRASILSTVSCLWLACGSDEPLPVRDAAAEVASAQCDWIEECGQWEFDCGEDGCTAARVELSEMECMADRQLDDFEDVECDDFTSDEAALVDACIDGLAARPCITQDEVDAYLDALEAGEDAIEPGSESPAACEELDGLLLDCLAGGE